MTVDGTEQSLGHVGEDEAWSPDRAGLAVAPASSSLSTLIRLRNATGHPVLLVEEGRLLGSCCQKEIIQALAGKRHSRRRGPARLVANSCRAGCRDLFKWRGVSMLGGAAANRS